MKGGEKLERFAFWPIRGEKRRREWCMHALCSWNRRGEEGGLRQETVWLQGRKE